MCQYNDSLERDVRFSVQCGVNNSKGIHIRNSVFEKAKEFVVNVTPIFPKSAGKIDFNYFNKNTFRVLIRCLVVKVVHDHILLFH